MRLFFPDDAGIGHAPMLLAKAASDLKRPGLPPAIAASEAAVTTPTPFAPRRGA